MDTEVISILFPFGVFSVLLWKYGEMISDLIQNLLFYLTYISFLLLDCVLHMRECFRKQSLKFWYIIYYKVPWLLLKIANNLHKIFTCHYLFELLCLWDRNALTNNQPFEEMCQQKIEPHIMNVPFIQFSYFLLWLKMSFFTARHFCRKN